MTDMCLRIDGLPQATKGYTLLPFQGVFAAINLPRALPWAMGFCPFGACFQMHVYDDRIEVWNDGSLPEGYTPETLMRSHSSKPRNKNVAFTFFKAGFIDRWGLGYKKIMDGFKEAGMKLPTIELVDGGVKVTVWRQQKSSDVADSVADEYTERQLLIIDTLKRYVADRKQNVADRIVPNTKYLASVLGVNRKTIQRELALLQAKEVVRWIGTDRNGYWKLTGLNTPIGQSVISQLESRGTEKGFSE